MNCGFRKNTNCSQSTMLTLATRYQKFSIAKLLIKKNADVNAIDGFNITPLIYASYYGSLDVVQLLVQKNADIFVKDYNNKLACDIAYMYGHIDICIYLKNKMKVFNFDNITRIQEYFGTLDSTDSTDSTIIIENKFIYKN